MVGTTGETTRKTSNGLIDGLKLLFGFVLGAGHVELCYASSLQGYLSISLHELEVDKKLLEKSNLSHYLNAATIPTELFHEQQQAKFPR
jgi:hypothetical protein